MTYEENRAQWQNPAYKKIVKDICGEVCYNCGSTEEIEYHHIVPLYVGGTNNISNIACLCSKCHRAVHWGGHIKDYRSIKRPGRPHKVPKEVLDGAFEAYIHGKIGTKECKKRIDMAKSTKITDMSYYKRFLKDRKIVAVQNSIDIKMKKDGFIKVGDVVCHVEYENGVEEVYKWGI